MQRVLVIRLLSLELGPMIAALTVSAYRQQLMGPAFLTASLLIFASVILSVRDGAVLEKWGYVCERKAEPIWFWFWLSAHCAFAIFCLACGIIVLLWPRP
jgi:hypothetical protein